MTSLLKVTSYTQEACAEAERIESVLDDLRNHKMPLRLLTRKQLSAAFSNFTQRLAELRLLPLSLSPKLLMWSRVQSSLKRQRLDTDRRRIRNLVAPLQGEGTDSAQKERVVEPGRTNHSQPETRPRRPGQEGSQVDPAHRGKGVNVPGVEDLFNSLNEDLILEVRLHVPVLRPVNKRLRRRVLTPRPQLFFREGSDRSDPGMLAISGPGFSLLIPPGRTDTHTRRQERVQEVRSNNLQQ